MARYPGKRKPNTVDFTDTEDDSTRASKASRTDSSLDSSNVSPDMRFDESADYIALPPLSQVAFAEEEEEDQANELIQGSQDDSSAGDFVMYGRLSSYDIPVIYI